MFPSQYQELRSVVCYTMKTDRDFDTSKPVQESPDAENERYRTVRRWNIAGITAALIIILLLLIGVTLMLYFTGEDQRDDASHSVGKYLKSALHRLNATLIAQVLYINNEISALGGIYVGNTVPPSTLGNPGSLYIQNQTGVVYYNVGHMWGVVFNASVVPEPITNCSVCVFNGTQTFIGPWNATVVYQSGDIVTYNSSLYITNSSNVVIVVPGTNTTVWQPYPGAIPGVPGPPGYPGGIGPMGPSLMYDGDWSPNITYSAGNAVVVNSTLYISVIGNNTNLYPPYSSASWSSVLNNVTLAPGPTGPQGPPGDEGQSFVFFGYWNSSLIYGPGNVVIYNNTIYTSLISNNTNVQPDTNSTAWLNNLAGLTGVAGSDGANGTDGISYMFIGAWNATQSYNPGNEVVYNGVFYVAVTQSIGNTPSNTSSAWSVALPSFTGTTGQMGANGTDGSNGQNIQFLGAWNSSASYTPGMVVVLNGSVYEAVANSSGQSPALNSSDWQLVVPYLTAAQGLPGAAGINGTSYFFLGNWNATQAYVGGQDYVVYNQTLFLAITNNTGQTPSNISSSWKQATVNVVGAAGNQGSAGANGTDGQSFLFEGTWNASQTYSIDQYVVYNGTLYIAANLSLDLPPVNNTSAWSYVLGPIVGPVGLPGLPGLNGSSGESFVFVGYWNASNAYTAGNIVIYNDSSVWVALDNSTGSVPSNSSMDWREIIPPLSGGTTGAQGPVGPSGLNGTAAVYLGAWTNGTTYSFLNVVLLNQTLYVALVNNVTDTPSNTSGDWRLLVGPFSGFQGAIGPQGINGTDGISYVYQGAWNASVLYLPYQEVTLSDGSLYAASATNINQYPVSNPSSWTLKYGNISGVAGPNGADGANATFVGTWNVTTNYIVGNTVIYNNQVYYAALPNTGVPPGTNSSVWLSKISQISVVGPQGLPGNPGPSNGAATIRLQGPGPTNLASTSFAYKTAAFTGLYSAYNDSSDGSYWFNSSLVLLPYNPPSYYFSGISRAIWRSEVSQQFNIIGGVYNGFLFRIDIVDYNNVVTNICPTAGYGAYGSGVNPYLNGTLPFNTTYSTVETILFTYSVTVLTGTGQDEITWSCNAVQLGTENYIYDYGDITTTQVRSNTLQKFSTPPTTPSAPNPTLGPVYFKLTYLNYIVDPSNLCGASPGVCMNQPLYATHTFENLQTNSTNSFG